MSEWSQRDIDDLVARLRAMARAEHDDLSIGDEAADAIDAMCAKRDELAIQVAAMSWMPIETAPPDGKLTLVYRPLAHEIGHLNTALLRIVGGNHYCDPKTVPPGHAPTNPTDGRCHATHWMIEPPPPQAYKNSFGSLCEQCHQRPVWIDPNKRDPCFHENMTGHQG